MDDDCPICAESISLPYTLPCKHQFCYLCIKRAYEEKSACPYCRAPITENIHDEACLQATSGTKNVPQDTLPTTFTWIYAGANYGYWQFDPRSNNDIEEAYITYQRDPTKSSFTLYIMGRPYEINFVSMKQYIKQGGRRASRDILRLPKGMDGRPINTDPNITIKGIAGLQWENEMRDALMVPGQNCQLPVTGLPAIPKGNPTLIRKPKRTPIPPPIVVDSSSEEIEASEEEKSDED